MRAGSTTFHHTEVRDTRQPESRPTFPRAEAGDGQVTLTWGVAYPEDPSITGWEYRTRVWGPTSQRTQVGGVGRMCPAARTLGRPW